MTDDILKKILKKVLPELAGTGSEKIVELLYNKQNVNEFLISKKLGMTINQTRNVLYRLGDKGLIEFTRKKDKKKGGWYTYFWTLKVKKILERLKEETLRDLEHKKEEIKKRQNERYYYSPSIDREFTEEEAILDDFICPETGEVLQMKDNTELLNKTKNEINRMENNLLQIQQEIEKIEIIEGKSNERKIKAEQKKKEMERKRKKEEREKEKAKEAKSKKSVQKNKNSSKKNLKKIKKFLKGKNKK